jgi:hypothetical protein
MFEYQAIARSIFRSAYLVNIPEKERFSYARRMSKMSDGLNNHLSKKL